MKTASLLSQVSLCWALLGLTAFSQDSLSIGLVAHYPFEGKADDASGNGNHGTAFNGVTYVPGPPERGWASHYSGDSQFVSLPASISNYLDLTVAFWLKTTASNPNPFIGSTFLVSRDVPYAAYDWNISLGLGRKILFHTGSPLDDNRILVSPDIASGEWVHVACVVASASDAKKIFLNGAQVAATAHESYPFANNGIPVLVGRTATQERYYSGDIDDLRFYSRALSSDEILQLWAAPCRPHAATATAVVLNGFVVGATLTDSGCGYTNPPLVRIVGGGGSGAEAYAQISFGSVTNIVITDAGSGYTNAPLIIIASPPFTPWLTIGVSSIAVVQHVVLGNTYALESSFNMIDWVQQGADFVAESEVITNYFDVSQTGQFFRIRQVP